MSWCDACQRGFELQAGSNACPVCAQAGLVSSASSEPRQAGSSSLKSTKSRARKAQARTGPPWHFWLVIAAAALYLGWRVVEALVWVVMQIF